MSEFLQKLWARLVLIVTTVRHWPIIEAVIDVLDKQRTIVLVLSLTAFGLLPKFISDAAWADRLGNAIFLGGGTILLGLTAEALMEARAQLPTSLKDIVKYFADELLKACVVRGILSQGVADLIRPVMDELIDQLLTGAQLAALVSGRAAAPALVTAGTSVTTTSTVVSGPPVDDDATPSVSQFGIPHALTNADFEKLKALGRQEQEKYIASPDDPSVG